MDTRCSIAECPTCHSLLRTPPYGMLLYRCGSCSAILQAKSAPLGRRKNRKSLSTTGVEHDGATVKCIDVDRTSKPITTEDEYNMTTSFSSQETTGNILDDYSGESSPPWSDMKFGAGRMLESASLSKRGQKPDAAALPNISLHKPEGGEQLRHCRSDELEVQKKVSGLQEPDMQRPLSTPVEQTNGRSSEMDLLVDCAGHRKLTSVSRQAHEEEVLDSSAKYPSEDLLFNCSGEQKSLPIDRPCSEEQETNGDRLYNTSSRHAGRTEISTIRQFNSEEVRVIKESSFQEQEQQLFTNEEYQVSTSHKELFIEPNCSPPHATQSTLPFPPNLTSSMQQLAKRAFQFNADEPSSEHMYGGQDLLDYETSEYSQMLGEVDPCGGMGLQSRSQSTSYQFDSPCGEALDGGQISGLNHIGNDIPQPLHKPKSVRVHKSSPHFQGQYSQHHLVTESPESSHTSSTKGYHQGKQTGGQTFAPVVTYHRRLRINTTLPEPNEQLRVVCQHCSLHLQVPPNMPNSHTGYQKLRCGSCQKISCFLLYPSYSSGEYSPAASSENLSPVVSDQFIPHLSDRLSGRDTDSNNETVHCDREVQTHSMLPLPPGRRQPQGSHGSKLSHMFTAPATSDQSSSSSSGDLSPHEVTIKGRPADSLEDTTRVSHTPALSTVDHSLDSAATDGLGSSQDRQHLQDLKYLGSTGDSEDDERVSIPMSTAAPQAVDLFPEVRGLRGFLRRSIKELTKSKDVNQFRRKVIVNGHAVPDAIVEKAEDLAGPIHPGSYWYDVRAGFWGLMGGPCLGMIPPFIEVLNFPLARHCSNGKTGVLVNKRELQHRDLELLKQRGLPGIPGKSYNLDIDGCLFDAVTGTELPGLGHLAPTLERSAWGPGMGVLCSGTAL